MEERIEAAPLAPQVSDHHIRHQYQQQRAITNENQVILQQLSLMRQQLQMEQEKLKAQKEKERVNSTPIYLLQFLNFFYRNFSLHWIIIAKIRLQSEEIPLIYLNLHDLEERRQLPIENKIK